MAIKLRPIAEQTMVITGATSGIGLATARRAARKGAKVVLLARREHELQRAVDAIRKDRGHAAYVVADVGVQREVEFAAEEAIRLFGGFDTWVNNAGVGVYGEALDTPISDQQQVFQTNYWGTVFGSVAAARYFRATGRTGALINVGSIVSEMAAPLLASYAASKHAIKGFTDTLRQELIYARAPVSVSLIKPSGIDTPFDAHARSHLSAEPSLPTPLIKPELVAEAILYAARHGARELTVGGAGRALTAMAKAAPSLSDRIIPRVMIPAQSDVNARRSHSNGLYTPAADNLVYADHGRPAGFDLYHTMRLHPRIVAAVATAIGAAVMWGASRRPEPRSA